jgi:hypothetical protein
LTCLPPTSLFENETHVVYIKKAFYTSRSIFLKNEVCCTINKNEKVYVLFQMF